MLKKALIIYKIGQSSPCAGIDKTIPIRKPKKPPGAKASNKSITLLSTLSKLVNKLILVRLKEHQQKLSLTQY